MKLPDFHLFSQLDGLRSAPNVSNARVAQIAETEIIEKVLRTGRDVPIPKDDQRVPGERAGAEFFRMERLPVGIELARPIMRGFQREFIERQAVELLLKIALGGRDRNRAGRRAGLRGEINHLEDRNRAAFALRLLHAEKIQNILQRVFEIRAAPDAFIGLFLEAVERK